MHPWVWLPWKPTLKKKFKSEINSKAPWPILYHWYLFISPENIRKTLVSDVFREDKDRPVAWNGLHQEVVELPENKNLFKNLIHIIHPIICFQANIIPVFTWKTLGDQIAWKNTSKNISTTITFVMVNIIRVSEIIRLPLLLWKVSTRLSTSTSKRVITDKPIPGSQNVRNTLDSHNSPDEEQVTWNRSENYWNLFNSPIGGSHRTCFKQFPKKLFSQILRQKYYFFSEIAKPLSYILFLRNFKTFEKYSKQPFTITFKKNKYIKELISLI